MSDLLPRPDILKNRKVKVTCKCKITVSKSLKSCLIIKLEPVGELSLQDSKKSCRRLRNAWQLVQRPSHWSKFKELPRTSEIKFKDFQGP